MTLNRIQHPGLQRHLLQTFYGSCWNEAEEANLQLPKSISYNILKMLHPLYSSLLHVAVTC